jgi:phytol kinase
MMLILTALVVFVLLVLSELWWRLRKPHDEFSRKFIHITVGSFVAFWPQFLSWNEILLLSGAFLVVTLLSLYFGIFKAIHAVERPTWGEICFGLAVGLLAVLTKDAAIYMIAVLHMSLADGVAALFGTAYGRKNSYKVFGHTKSLAGSGAFLLVSLVLLIGYASFSAAVISPVLIVALALTATALENFAVRGLDNLFVPLLVAAVLALTG